MAQGIASLIVPRCGSGWLRREARGVSRNARFSGFTLIELLVVIAIIAMLAALLLPSLNRAKRSAEDTVCRNNLRQQAIGLVAYVGDFGAYPLGLSPPVQGQDNLLWMQKLEKYVGDKWSTDTETRGSGKSNGVQPRGVYSCPSYNRVGGMYYGGGSSAVGAYGYSALVGSYGPAFVTGSVSIRPLGSGDGGRAVSESEVVAPTQMIAVGDSQIEAFANFAATDPITGFFEAPLSMNTLVYLARRVQLPSDPSTAAMLRRHAGRWNMAFCDGHVEHGTVLTFFDWSRDEVVKRWSRDNQTHRQ